MRDIRLLVLVPGAPAPLGPHVVNMPTYTRRHRNRSWLEGKFNFPPVDRRVRKLSKGFHGGEAPGRTN